MVKKVLRIAGSQKRTALWAFGWIAFAAVFFVKLVAVKLILMSLARVLP